MVGQLENDEDDKAENENTIVDKGKNENTIENDNNRFKAPGDVFVPGSPCDRVDHTFSHIGRVLTFSTT